MGTQSNILQYLQSLQAPAGPQINAMPIPPQLAMLVKNQQQNSANMNMPQQQQSMLPQTQQMQQPQQQQSSGLLSSLLPTLLSMFAG